MKSITNAIILALMIWKHIQCLVTYSGNFTSPGQIVTIIYPITTSSTYINFVMSVAPSYDAVLMVTKTTNTPPSNNRTYWIHKISKQSSQYDYEGLVTGRDQYAWQRNPGAGQNIYIYIVNFQQTAIASYQVVVTQTNTITKTCSTTQYYVGTTYCIYCPASKIGVYCQVTNQNLSPGNNITVDVSAKSYTVFTLESQNDATVDFATKAGGIRLYFQYIVHSNEIAGIVNYLKDSNGQGAYFFNSSGYMTANFNNDNSYVSAAIINTNNYSTTVAISFSEASHINVMLIIIGILGGLMFLGLMIIFIIIIRRKNNPQRIIHPQVDSTMNRIRRQSISKLSQQDIEHFFPAISRALVFPSLNGSVTQLDLKDDGEYECVICLCPIESEQLIRVCYCKHVFHGHCLSQWFSKQQVPNQPIQNCPYCRKDYNRSETVNLYNELKRESGKQLKGIQIIKQIFQPKIDATLQTLHVQDIEEHCY